MREIGVFLSKEPVRASRHVKSNNETQCLLLSVMLSCHNSKRYITFCWLYKNSVVLQKHLFSWFNCISIASHLYLLAPGGSVFIILARSFAVADQTGSPLCLVYAEPNPSVVVWAALSHFIRGGSKIKKKCFYSLKSVRQFLNLREHTQRGAGQLELQCKPITIKTRHTTLLSTQCFILILPSLMKQYCWKETTWRKSLPSS